MVKNVPLLIVLSRVAALVPAAVVVLLASSFVSL